MAGHMSYPNTRAARGEIVGNEALMRRIAAKLLRYRVDADGAERPKWREIYTRELWAAAEMLSLFGFGMTGMAGVQAVTEVVDEVGAAPAAATRMRREWSERATDLLVDKLRELAK